jgi:hypothetical protein
MPSPVNSSTKTTTYSTKTAWSCTDLPRHPYHRRRRLHPHHHHRRRRLHPHHHHRRRRCGRAGPRSSNHTRNVHVGGSYHTRTSEPTRACQSNASTTGGNAPSSSASLIIRVTTPSVPSSSTSASAYLCMMNRHQKGCVMRIEISLLSSNAT